MLNVSRQFAAKATALRNNRFQAVRLRLTALYALLLIIIITISSFATYMLFSGRIEHRFGDSDVPTLQVEAFEKTFPHDARDEARSELLLSLLIVNSSLLLFGTGASFWLAGRTLKPIQEAYEQQRHFFSDASHELRTPLAILRVDLENELANSSISASEKNNVQSHLEEVVRMSSLVNNLLLISRLDSNLQENVDIQPINLNHIIEKTVLRLQPYAEKHNISISLSPMSEQNITVHANQEHIVQALRNIIKNGIDYNKQNGTVSVSLTTDQGRALVTISDTGIGISQEDTSQIFNRFYRVEKSRSRSFGGSGLGLSIVQTIAQKYGGSVSIKSEINKGTTIYFSLPYEQHE